MRALLALAVAVLLAAPCGAADPPDRASVTLSNGERVQGRFSLTEGKKLEVFDTKQKRRVAIDAAEVARVSVTVEWEKLEQAWMWREESNHEKIKLPYRYPLRKLTTEVTLVSGEVVSGHATCVFYVEVEGAEEARRLFLLADQKGEKDQRLEDLVYVKEVVLPGRAVGVAKLVTIKAPEPAAAVALDRDASFESPLASLLSGRYDVFLFPRALPDAAGERARVRYGLTGTALEKDELRRLEEKVASIEEFFPSKRVVATAKEGSTLRAFLELARTEETTDAGWGFVRWEVWTFDASSPTLDVRKRLFLHRLRFAREKGAPSFEYVPEEKLRSVKESVAIE